MSTSAVSAPPRFDTHPLDDLLRTDRIPHIWCPTCGLGVVLNAFLTAVRDGDIPRQDIAVVSGIGCTGRSAGYVRLDSFHTTHGRALPFATGLKLANPKLKVVVISGDGDLAAIGGNHLIHTARRNMDLTVICVNNFNYAMTGGQFGPTTPRKAKLTTAPYGSFEHPFNLPFLVDSCGATYVARWTALHARQMLAAFKEALHHRGFSFVEIISPCPTVYARRNQLGTGLDIIKYYRDKSIVKHNIDTRECDIRYQESIIVGRFVRREKQTYLDTMHEHLTESIGAKYVPYQGPMHGPTGTAGASDGD